MIKDELLNPESKGYQMLSRAKRFQDAVAKTEEMRKTGKYNEGDLERALMISKLSYEQGKSDDFSYRDPLRFVNVAQKLNDYAKTIKPREIEDETGWKAHPDGYYQKGMTKVSEIPLEVSQYVLTKLAESDQEISEYLEYTTSSQAEYASLTGELNQRFSPERDIEAIYTLQSAKEEILANKKLKKSTKDNQIAQIDAMIEQLEPFVTTNNPAELEQMYKQRYKSAIQERMVSGNINALSEAIKGTSTFNKIAIKDMNDFQLRKYNFLPDPFEDIEETSFLTNEAVSEDVVDFYTKAPDEKITKVLIDTEGNALDIGQIRDYVANNLNEFADVIERPSIVSFLRGVDKVNENVTENRKKAEQKIVDFITNTLLKESPQKKSLKETSSLEESFNEPESIVLLRHQVLKGLEKSGFKLKPLDKAEKDQYNQMVEEKQNQARVANNTIVDKQLARFDNKIANLKSQLNAETPLTVLERNQINNQIAAFEEAKNKLETTKYNDLNNFRKTLKDAYQNSEEVEQAAVLGEGVDQQLFAERLLKGQIGDLQSKQFKVARKGNKWKYEEPKGNERPEILTALEINPKRTSVNLITTGKNAGGYLITGEGDNGMFTIMTEPMGSSNQNNTAFKVQRNVAQLVSAGQPVAGGLDNIAGYIPLTLPNAPASGMLTYAVSPVIGIKKTTDGKNAFGVISYELYPVENGTVLKDPLVLDKKTFETVSYSQHAK
jgi:hypothetical protein